MLTTKEQKKAAEELSNSSTLVGKGTVIEGNIETSGTIRIEGKVTGNVTSRSKVVLGPLSSVLGDILALNADIEGEVKGNLEIGELLTLKSTSVTEGDIQTSKLVVEPGASFNGKCTMGNARNLRISDNGIRSKESKTA
ncbi:MAG: bactofilin family protein [Cyclobacteriaceae bacterium]